MTERNTTLELATDIVAAYVGNNTLPAEELPALIQSTYEALMMAEDTPRPEPEKAPVPAVPIVDSLTDDFIICLEDGKPFKSLKRHLRTKFDMTPEAYREKWGLPHDYPMVAPNYAKERSKLAKKMGLGKSES